MALDEGADPSDLQAIRASWKRSAESWVSQKAEAGEETTERPAKRRKYRKKSYEWLLSVENMLQLSTGCGFQRYIFSEEELAARPFEMPLLRVAADQGPDGVCAIGYLSRKNSWRM